MGFKTGNFPEVDPATFRDQPFLDRVRAMATHWVDYGFGTPKMASPAAGRTRSCTARPRTGSGSGSCSAGQECLGVRSRGGAATFAR